MREIIIGTNNPVKIEQIKGVIQPLGLIVMGIDKEIILPKVKEDGKTVQENFVKSIDF